MIIYRIVLIPLLIHDDACRMMNVVFREGRKDGGHIDQIRSNYSSCLVESHINSSGI
jgi:hypothetical protein